MAGAADTPMMRQYLQIKAQVPDALLLYRMGDFYELFFDDAREAAEILELTLTSRNKDAPDSIPMAGVPYHALEGYLRRLVDAGRKVAIAEQSEPDSSGGKLMQRDLVRVVTPGVPWTSDELDAREPCWLVGLCGDGPVGVALLDVSTGDLRLTEVDDVEAALTELARVEPRELIVHPTLVDRLRRPLSAIPRTAPEPAWFDEEAGRTALRDLLGTADLLGFGAGGLGPAIGAAGALVSYVRDDARLALTHVRRLAVYSVRGHMVLDEATRRNLEITRPLRGTGRAGTLLKLLDRTATAMGGRLLREWLVSPLVDVGAIRARADAVESLVGPPDAGAARQSLRERLKLVADLERLAGKASQGTAHARDLVALAASLEALPGIAQLLDGRPALAGRLRVEPAAQAVAADIRRWLVDEPPLGLSDGGLVRRGVDADVDELTALTREGKGAIARIEARERDETGISSLRIKHNRVFGYFLEVSQAKSHMVPESWIRKQTLANCERFVTPELKEFEEKVLGADEKRKALEYQRFKELRERVAEHVGLLQGLAGAVAWVDVAAAFAEVAVDRRYVRPTVDAGAKLEIVGGRHPVVESMALDEPFVPNDLRLDDDARMVILTGPNMAGKSTVMRQAALIALMAQVGSFVPADKAHIGLCDRIFVRVGASDDLAHGRSTFMVEMSETALILNQASARSLILLDEIGRGTSTYDGLAIAWAVAEAMHDRVGARCIFATHYHEMVALADELSGVVNLQVAVSEWADRIVFLRTLKSGGASKSYGIQCARLAGMPGAVIERARELLLELEKRPRYGPPTAQLPLFGARPPAQPAVPPRDRLREALAELEPDDLSPRAALEAIYRLRTLLLALLALLGLSGPALGASLQQLRVFAEPGHARLLLVVDGATAEPATRSSPPVGTAPARGTVVLAGTAPGADGDRVLQVDDSGVQAVRVAAVGNDTQVTVDLDEARIVRVESLAKGAWVVDLDVEQPEGTVVASGLPTSEQLRAWVDGVSLVRAAGGPPRERRVVVVDAGHGGWDHGAVGASGTREADVALQIALRTARELDERLGVDVILTRDTDVFVPLRERAAIANRNDADLFLSIHANASPLNAAWGTTDSGRGIETYSLDTASDAGAARVAARENAVMAERGDGEGDLFSKLLTTGNNRLSRELAATVQRTVVDRLAAVYGEDQVKDLGNKTALFYVLHSTRMPAVLFESSFVSHPDDERRLRAPHFQAEMALAIVDAVGDWLARQQ